MRVNTVLMTGATGFIGQHMVNALLFSGRNVVALHRRTSDVGLLLHERLHWISAHDEEALRRCRPEAVIHLATCYGEDSSLSEVLESNVALPLRILETATKNDCAVFITTDTFFSKPEFNYLHMQPYITSKKEFIRWAALETNSPSCPKIFNCRLEHVYGANDGPRKFVPYILNKLTRNEPIELTPGHQLRDFIHVDDVVRAYLRLLEKHEDMASGITEIGVGTEMPVSVRDFVETAKKVSGSNSELFFGAKPLRKDEIMQSVANASLLRRLGWKPYHDMASGIAQTLRPIHRFQMRIETGTDAKTR